MIRFGLIGTNWITDRFLDAASGIDDFQLKAVYSRSEEKAKEFAQKHGAELTFTDIETMAKHEGIDAIYIASPNALHAEQAILCMQNGKHVLCEKPLASNAKEVKEMIAAAKSNGVLLMEAMKSTFIPSFMAIKDHLHKIGPVRRYTASFCQYSSRYDAYRAGEILNAFKPELSNGSLMDIGIYCLYPAITLFGKPTSIKANGLLLDSGVDGQGSILLQYDEMEAVITYSKITDSALPNEIQGEDGTILIDKISSPAKVTLLKRDGSTEDLSQPQVSNTMFYEINEFISLIKANKTESAINTFERSLAAAEIMDEARKQIGVVYPADTHS
ncbi:Gfo/Idh/MocA family protein [Bacillus testis]|uniref:Gfo/Idh/MocA family protein n=1 Tax=Bacillus testis TaxID=1622072 RepID=UPI00067EE09C|nr:Gfo/Idh/MocA family oxidoreductase [Bacillus testis]